MQNWIGHWTFLILTGKGRPSPSSYQQLKNHVCFRYIISQYFARTMLEPKTIGPTRDNKNHQQKLSRGRPGFQARRVKVQKRSSRMQAQGRASSTRVSCSGLHQEKFTAQAQKTETPARSSWKRMPFLGICGKKPVGNIDISDLGKSWENHGVFTSFRMYQEYSSIFMYQNKWWTPNLSCSLIWEVRTLITCNYRIRKKTPASVEKTLACHEEQLLTTCLSLDAFGIFRWLDVAWNGFKATKLEPLETFGWVLLFKNILKHQLLPMNPPRLHGFPHVFPMARSQVDDLLRVPPATQARDAQQGHGNHLEGKAQHQITCSGRYPLAISYIQWWFISIHGF